MSFTKLARVIERFIPKPVADELRSRLRPRNATRLPVQPSLAPELPEWEFQDHWVTDESGLRGWNVRSIATAQLEKWPAFVSQLAGHGPLGISHEEGADSTGENFWAHNLVTSYAYCVTLASRFRKTLSLLDWGGGIGHYFMITQAVLPEVEVDYYCQDVPALCEAGRSNLPDVQFLERPDACFRRNYDFVHAGSSLWYCEDWRETSAKLAESTAGYLYIARMLFINNADSFVAVQRPHRYGYDTEYQCWVLNRSEFLTHMETLNVQLVREFYFGKGPNIHNAPEGGDFRGFLFRAMGVPDIPEGSH